MLRIAATALVSSLCLAGCAGVGHGPPVPTSPGELEWVEGPTADVRSLVLRPSGLAPDPTAEPTPVTLSVGAYLARMETEEGERNHLALLVQLHGNDRALDLDLSRGLVAEIDGTRYVASHTLGGESVHMTRTPEGRLVSLSFPMDRSDLTHLTRAGQVRLQVGGSCFFVLSRRDQARLRAFLDRLPPDRMAQPVIWVTTD